MSSLQEILDRAIVRHGPDGFALLMISIDRVFFWYTGWLI
jgi:hypothetical protein